MKSKTYRVFETSDIWDVIEQPTGQIISTWTHRQPAKKQANFLNGGNGFNGWTPPFILRGI